MKTSAGRATALLFAVVLASADAHESLAQARAAAAASDPVQQLLDAGALKSAFNPVLLSFLTEEAKGRLPEPQRKAAVDQLVIGFKQSIDIKPSGQVAAGLATALGSVLGGTAGRGISEGAAQVWTDWVDAAFVLQKAGNKEDSNAFFENCLQNFPYESLRARCGAGLAAGKPDKAFEIVVGLLDSKHGDEVNNMGLRLLGALAGAEGVPKEQKDAAFDELVKRSKGFSHAQNFGAAVDGLIATKDPRAVEPLRGLSKGLTKTDDIKHAALRGLAVGFGDAQAIEALQKQLKGGFMKEPKDQVWAALILIEAAQPAGFDWATQYLTNKKKKEPDFSDDVVDAVIAKGGDAAKDTLSKSFAAQKPNSLLAARMAIGLLNLGDSSHLETVKGALANNDWPFTRLHAAVALAHAKDYSGIPVLQALVEPQPQSVWKAAADYVTKGGKPDPDAVRAHIADALGAIDHKDAVPVLVSLLADKSDRVRMSAAYALSRMTDPAALDGLAPALGADYGKEGARTRNPEVLARLLRRAALTFPKDARTAALCKKGSESSFASVKFLALAEAKVAAK